MSCGGGFYGTKQFCVSSTCSVDICLKKGTLENITSVTPLFSLFSCLDFVHLTRFARIMVVQENFVVTPGSSLICFFFLRVLKNEGKLSRKSNLQSALIVLLLLISGNVQPNPGPDVVTSFNTPTDKSSTGLRIVHLNVRSIFTKFDMLRIWADPTDADIMVLSEIWLKNSIPNKDISIVGYNVYRADQSLIEVEELQFLLKVSLVKI